jgi:hypothetical protein
LNAQRHICTDHHFAGVFCPSRPISHGACNSELGDLRRNQPEPQADSAINVFRPFERDWAFQCVKPISNYRQWEYIERFTVQRAVDCLSAIIALEEKNHCPAF